MLKVPINAKMSFNREKLPGDPPKKATTTPTKSCDFENE